VCEGGRIDNDVASLIFVCLMDSFNEASFGVVLVVIEAQAGICALFCESSDDIVQRISTVMTGLSYA
jgi:hypothetical protein